MPAGGGVPGQPIAAYLVGRSRFVLIDPGDPIGPGLELAIATAAERGGTIEAIALTQVAPDHAAGAEGLSEMLGGLPILAGPGAGDRSRTPSRRSPTPRRWPTATSRSGPSTRRARRRSTSRSWWARDTSSRATSMAVGRPLHPEPARPAAVAASAARLRAMAPDATWLPSHPSAEPA